VIFVFIINLTYHNNPDWVIVDHCLPNERVFLSVDKGQSDFTYVCEYMFKYLDISLHFSDFKCEVLIEMNVALTQLHPNNWTFMKAFLILCYYLNITLNCQQVFVLLLG